MHIPTKILQIGLQSCPGAVGIYEEIVAVWFFCLAYFPSSFDWYLWWNLLYSGLSRLAKRVFLESPVYLAYMGELRLQVGNTVLPMTDPERSCPHYWLLDVLV